MEDILKVQRAIDGDKKAFEDLIKEHKVYLYKLAYKHVKYEEDAKDIFQETVYKAYIGIKKLKKPQFFKTWISKILINTANTHLTKNGMIDLEYEAKDFIKIKEIEGDKEIKIDLNKAIDTLEAKYKTVIILRYYYDLKLEEIAEQIDCPVNTVKTHIRRGLIDMKKLLKEGYTND